MSEDAEDKDKAAERRPPPIELLPWQRWSCAIAGIAFSGVAGWATIFSHLDGVGTVAFVIVGCILILLACIGVVPSKAWGAGAGFEMYRREVQEQTSEVVDAAVEQMAPEQVQRWLDLMESSSPSDLKLGSLNIVTSASSRIAKNVTFEQKCYQLLTEAMAAYSMKVTASEDRSDFDYVVRLPHGRRLLIEILLGGSPAAIRKRAARAASHREDLLVITSDPNSVREFRNSTKHLANNYGPESTVIVTVAELEPITAILEWLVRDKPRDVHPDDMQDVYIIRGSR